MAEASVVPTGITKRRWTGFLWVALAILIPFAFLYVSARRSIINEIRQQAIGVAVAAAAAIQPSDLAEIYGPGDVDKPAYRRVSGYLAQVQVNNPDVRYIYVMRRSENPGTTERDFEYVVDAPSRDIDGNGEIERDEMAEPPGKPYKANNYPAMIRAWHHPDADNRVFPDPPYPDLMSGYAPVKNDKGQTFGIVGVDITAATVSQKLLVLRGVVFIVWFLLSLLVLLVLQLYYQQQEVLEHNKALASELATRNDMLRAANAQLAHTNERHRREMQLAESMQMQFLPERFPRQDKIIFDKYYLTCEMLGGDIYDVFSLDEDHVGMYVADVAGHGASAALVSGLLKMAVSAVRDHKATLAGDLPANLLDAPRALERLNRMLMKEIPDYSFITMIYAVYDIPNYSLFIANAGHLPPLKYDPRADKVVTLDVPAGMAIGLSEDATYQVVEKHVQAGDKIIFFSDGVIDTINDQGEEFGIERLNELVLRNGKEPPGKIIAQLTDALKTHRGSQEIRDDYSLLVAEIR